MRRALALVAGAVVVIVAVVLVLRSCSAGEPEPAASPSRPSTAVASPPAEPPPSAVPDAAEEQPPNSDPPSPETDVPEIEGVDEAAAGERIAVRIRITVKDVTSFVEGSETVVDGARVLVTDQAGTELGSGVLSKCPACSADLEVDVSPDGAYQVLLGELPFPFTGEVVDGVVVVEGVMDFNA